MCCWQRHKLHLSFCWKPKATAFSGAHSHNLIALDQDEVHLLHAYDLFSLDAQELYLHDTAGHVANYRTLSGQTQYCLLLKCSIVVKRPRLAELLWRSLLQLYLRE